MHIKAETRGGVRSANNSGLLLRQKRSNTRIEKRDGKRMIRGYAAVFYNEADPEGTEYWLWSDMVERIMPGAFDRAIKEAHDARGLFNHDGNWLLGRVSSGTARLSVDTVGLAYEIDEDPADPQWATVAAKIDRGDVTGSSFAFRATQTIWVETPDYFVRQVVDCDLYDVSPVTWPAYTGTTAGRSADLRSDAPPHIQELIAERQRFFADDFVLVNARLAKLGMPLLKD